MLGRASSTTSWRTSTSSSTSDGPRVPPHVTARRPSGLAALATRLRLVHPFPSFLNAAAVAALAWLAGGGGGAAVRLGVAMFAIQASIGALNDLADADLDDGRRPPKPIPSGLVTRRTAALVAGLGAGIGLGLSAAFGPGPTLVAAAGLGCGYAYDLRLSRTPWSWLPLALALPLVPVYAWLGAVGVAPAEVLLVVPIGILAGAGLAIGNGLADHDLDAASGTGSLAVRLGERRSWALHAGLLSAAVVTAIASARWAGPAGPAAGLAGAAGAVVIAVGVALLAPGRDRRRIVGLLGWGVEAVGVTILGLAWLAAAAGRVAA